MSIVVLFQEFEETIFMPPPPPRSHHSYSTLKVSAQGGGGERMAAFQGMHVSDCVTCKTSV